MVLDTYIDYLTKYPLEEISENQGRHKFNLNKEEWNAIIQLKNDNSLVIKEGDKGGACVIMESDYYKDKVMLLLSDETTYKKIENENLEEKILIKIKRLTRRHEDELTKKEVDYLTNFDYKPSNVYGLPKVHKCKEVLDKVQNSPNKCVIINCPQSLTMRPIIAGPKCVTSSLSDFIDKILRPLLKRVDSYVRDDIDFLTKMPRDANKSKVLATFDISSMYTNIDNNLGQEAIKFGLEKYPESKTRNIPNDFILEALKIVLENNTFNFNNKTFLQIRGTAMGTKCAPVYATLVMAFLEIKLYNKFQECYGLEARNKFQSEWMRYLDDCFIYWDTKMGPITELHNILNDLHERIKFTVETNYEKMNFLDIQMTAKNDKIITDIYFKPTDTHNYIPFKSAHPRHTLINIPYNLARRLCTIIDEKNNS